MVSVDQCVPTPVVSVDWEIGLKSLGGRPTPGTTGHLQISVYRLQVPEVTGDHNVCFGQTQDDMGKVHSVRKDLEFVSKGNEISLRKFVPEYFTPLTLDVQTGVVSVEDTSDV